MSKHHSPAPVAHIQIFRLFPTARRSHTKSKSGCRECKRRRQKCSEEKPRCRACAKRNLDCIYAARMAATGESPDGAESIQPLPWKETSLPPSIAAHGVGHFDQDDMLLWHHFITCTSSTFSDPWTVDIPALALSHHFLMQGILATAALHLAYLQPSRTSRYLYISARHQDLAMKGFQLVMPAVTPENCNAVFAFSTLLLVHNLTSQFNEYSNPSARSSHDLESIRAWIVLLRGCTTVYLSARASLEAGPFGRRLTEFHVPEVPTDDAYDRRLCRLSQALLADLEIMEMSSEDEMETYQASIYQLRLTSAASRNADPLLDYRAIMIVWATRLPDQFLWLFNDRRPPALIIMSYACMLLKRGERLWFMEGRIGIMLDSLRAELSSEWHRYLNL